ncbi:MAG: glucose-1-phosphate cytidylyltransferase [Lachnospiraceae bacterium]|nr:glucose-1-phosphate cytidylyltransferase [Lachnospiraceae bacterium]
MKVVILAGGMGSRISEESHLRPKPMIEIGGRPILWHIMKIYSYYGFNDFIICCGYKGHMIKEYFIDYYMNESDITVDLTNNDVTIHQNMAEPWKVTLVNTGLYTPTAGRIRQVMKYTGEEPFMMTYGDGVSDVNITDLLDFHKKMGKIATITAARPAGRWGTIQVDDERQIVTTFKEKEKTDQAFVNAGFAVFNPEIENYLDEEYMLETLPYESLTEAGQMAAYRHEGFWYPMDTIRDRDYLESEWAGGDAPWKLW